MLITREPTAQKKIQFRIRMNINIYEQVMEYCQWAGINKRDFFVEQACKYILHNDADWVAYSQSGNSENVIPLPQEEMAINTQLSNQLVEDDKQSLFTELIEER